MDALLSFTTLSATVLLSMPYVLAALGGVSSERAGVVNIALEGILLSGAFAAAAITHASGSPWLGLAGAGVCGVLVALGFAFFVVTLGVDQIIAGLAVNLAAAGATRVGTQLLWGQAHSEQVQALPRFWELPPDAGGALELLHTLTAQPIVLLAIALIVGVTVLHTRSVLGLRLRAAGESAAATASVGLSVARLRYAGVLLSGLLAGLGGAWLVFDVSQFSEGISAGKGYIAMAAVVFGRWHPLGAAAGCVLFGGCGAVAEALERGGSALPSELVGALPYVLCILVLVGLVGRARPPACLGRPFRPGDE